VRIEELPLRGEPLRARLRELGMTQTDLADALDIRPQSVQHWVNGRTGPNSRLVPKVIEVLQLEVESRSDNERLVSLEVAVSQLRAEVADVTALLAQLVRQQTDAVEAEHATPVAKGRRRSQP